MPTPKKNEKEKDYVERCIPIVLHEGTAKDGAQASAICHSKYQEYKKKKKKGIAGFVFQSVGFLFSSQHKGDKGKFSVGYLKSLIEDK